MYKACVFDLDGTLADTVEALAYTTNLMLEKYGLGPIPVKMYYQFVGDGYKKQVERALIYAGDQELVHYEDALHTYMDIFEKTCLYHVKAYDGMEKTLSVLKKRGRKLAVFSNKPHGQTIDTVEGIFGKDVFDVIRGQQETVPKKPDPAGALLVAKELGVLPSECLYLGDTNTDMKTGKNAGMNVVGVLWGFRDREELEAFSPQYLIEKPEEILAIIKSAEE